MNNYNAKRSNKQNQIKKPSVFFSIATLVIVGTIMTATVSASVTGIVTLNDTEKTGEVPSGDGPSGEVVSKLNSDSKNEASSEKKLVEIESSSEKVVLYTTLNRVSDVLSENKIKYNSKTHNISKALDKEIVDGDKIIISKKPEEKKVEVTKEVAKKATVKKETTKTTTKKETKKSSSKLKKDNSKTSSKNTSSKKSSGAVLVNGESLNYSKKITMTATAYTYGEDGGNVTATGKPTKYGYVAVDPRVIPLGTRLYIRTASGSFAYGYAVAEDTGGAIKGNKIDLFMNSMSEANAFGRRQVEVYVLK